MNTQLTFSIDDLGKFLHTLEKRSEKSASLMKTKFEELVRGSLKRWDFKRKHGFVPTNVTFSPTYWCNLECLDCYSGSSDDQRETLNDETTDRAINESSEKWSTLFYTITGGESLHHALKIAKRNPDKLFQLYTNGTLVTERIAERIAQLGNLFPLVSIEGSQEETDNVRGGGTYQKVIDAMDILTEKNVVWGIAFTLTSNNADVYDNGFLDDFISKGALVGRFLTYMPTGREADFERVPSSEQRNKQGEALRKTNGTEFYGLDYLNNPGLLKGCQVSGLRYFHIDPKGEIYPCVFLPIPAVFNLSDAYDGVYSREGLDVNCLEDILVRDPMLRLSREIAKKRDYRKCCLVIDNPDEFREACSQLARNFPRSEFGSFFESGYGQQLLETYQERLLEFSRR
ncbi:MAG: radical SAM protein [Nanoarchaeota archaeon]|nr:radical SAM protein [Nanoarchaeota archaeon]